MSKTLVWAHRGASGYAPENTLVSFQKAADMQADGIELDVQRTKDGKLVIMHDETVDRVSDGKGWLKDYTYEELEKLNVNLNFPAYGVVRVPTLEEVYRLVLKTEMTVNVELKTGVLFYEGIEEEVLELTKKMGMLERTVFSSFNHYSIMKMKKLDSSVKTGFLYEDGFLDMPGYAAEHGVEALHPYLYCLQYPNFLEECREKGIAVRPWTINEYAEMKEMCENGIDAMITNYPDIGRKVVKEYAGSGR